jgi:hypothetical protein
VLISAICLARRSRLATAAEGIVGLSAAQPPDLVMPGLVTRWVEQAPRDAGLVESRLAVLSR